MTITCPICGTEYEANGQSVLGMVQHRCPMCGTSGVLRTMTDAPADGRVTCPSCKATFNLPDDYIERHKREGQPVRCPMSFCQHILIKNEGEPTNENATSD